MSEEAEARLGATLGNYRLLSLLGSGGMGVVYKAEHVYIGKLAAIKVLHGKYAGSDDAVKRFLREAWAASAINHPNIVDVLDFGEAENGSVFLVMEYVEGKPLDQVLGEQRRLDLLRSITILTQMTSALSAAHALGIFHRDLKPENILLNRRPGRRELVRRISDARGERSVVEHEGEFDFVKVLDFGVAKVLQRTTEEGDHHTSPLAGVFDGLSTHSDVIFGTPEYMAPEAARGGPADLRTDIYAAGAMFYEMLTGVVPLEGETAMDTLLKQISEPVIPPRKRAPKAEITDAAERTIMKALAKNADDRHQSMAELRDDLQNCFGTLTYKRAMERTAVTRAPAPAAAPKPMPLLKPKVKPAPLADEELFPYEKPAPQPLQLTKKKPGLIVPAPAQPMTPRPMVKAPDKPRRGTLPLGTASVGAPRKPAGGSDDGE